MATPLPIDARQQRFGERLRCMAPEICDDAELARRIAAICEGRHLLPIGHALIDGLTGQRISAFDSPLNPVLVIDATNARVAGRSELALVIEQHHRSLEQRRTSLLRARSVRETAKQEPWLALKSPAERLHAELSPRYHGATPAICRLWCELCDCSTCERWRLKQNKKRKAVPDEQNPARQPIPAPEHEQTAQTLYTELEQLFAQDQSSLQRLRRFADLVGFHPAPPQ